MNIFTFKQLLAALGRSNNVTIVKAEQEDFQDWDRYLSLFYRDFKEKGSGTIKRNDIFSCEYLTNHVGNHISNKVTFQSIK